MSDMLTILMVAHMGFTLQLTVLAVLRLVAGGPIANATLSSQLFPVSPQLSSWTTSPSISGALPLADSTFRPHNQISALKHPYVNAPDGEYSMEAYYPAGSYNFDNSPQGGFSFYAPGPANVDLTTAKEATFGYTTYFPAGYQFVKGGKLPGLCEGHRHLRRVHRVADDSTH